MKNEKYERLQGLGFDFGGPIKPRSKKTWEQQYESLVGE
jgi:hypothetical protein